MKTAPPITALLFMKAHSERVPGKNMKLLCGRPLFHWILQSLSESRHIGRIVIDTDSDTIAASARRHFDVTVIPRPPHLRGDHVLANPMLAYDLTQIDGDLFFQTHATNPLLTGRTIDRALETFLLQSEHDSLIGVTPVRKRFYTCDGRAVNHDPCDLVMTQELDPVYEENSCMYVFSRGVFESRGMRIGTRPLLFPIDRSEAVDIDEPLDFTIADTLMRERRRRERGPTVVPFGPVREGLLRIPA